MRSRERTGCSIPPVPGPTSTVREAQAQALGASAGISLDALYTPDRVRTQQTAALASDRGRRDGAARLAEIAVAGRTVAALEAYVDVPITLAIGTSRSHGPAATGEEFLTRFDDAIATIRPPGTRRPPSSATAAPLMIGGRVQGIEPRDVATRHLGNMAVIEVEENRDRAGACRLGPGHGTGRWPRRAPAPRGAPGRSRPRRGRTGAAPGQGPPWKASLATRRADLMAAASPSAHPRGEPRPPWTKFPIDLDARGTCASTALPAPTSAASRTVIPRWRSRSALLRRGGGTRRCGGPEHRRTGDRHGRPRRAVQLSGAAGVPGRRRR